MFSVWRSKNPSILFTYLKDFLDIWSDENASELELLPILAVILSPSLCNISYFNEKIKENAHKFLRDKLLDMKEDDEDVFMETSNSTPKPVETLDLMDRYKITKNLSRSLPLICKYSGGQKFVHPPFKNNLFDLSFHP